MKFTILVPTLLLVCLGTANADVYYDNRTLWIEGGVFKSCALPIRCSSTDSSFRSVSEYQLFASLREGSPSVHEGTLRNNVQRLRNELDQIREQLNQPVGLEITTALEKNLAKKTRALRESEGTLENVVFLQDWLRRSGRFEIELSTSKDADGMSLGMVAAEFVRVFSTVKKKADEAEKTVVEANKKAADGEFSREKRRWENRKSNEHTNFRYGGGCNAKCFASVTIETRFYNQLVSRKESVVELHVTRSGNPAEARAELPQACADECKFDKRLRDCTLAPQSIRCY